MLMAVLEVFSGVENAGVMLMVMFECISGYLRLVVE